MTTSLQASDAMMTPAIEQSRALGAEGTVIDAGCSRAGFAAGPLVGSASASNALLTPGLDAWALLPEAERNDVRRWATALAEIKPPIVEALRRLAGTLGVSYSCARARYYAWLAAGRNALVLVNRSRVREGKTELTPEFLTEWHRRFCENQRNARAAHRKLMRDYRAGVPIPGLPAGWNRNGEPPVGWSYSNLMKHQPAPYVATAMRIGRTAAADHRPLVYTTRENLWVGSHYLFDDLWHDQMVNVLDTLQTGRPLEFHALDLYSACKIGWGFRVRTENVDTGKMEGLRGEHMRWLLACVLMEKGYHAYRGTVFGVERGTAAVPVDLEDLVYQLTNGMVTVDRSRMTGDPAFVGQYAGKSKGNFRFKAALESLGNLVHNELADTAGQTGLSVDRRPEELHGLLAHNDDLVAAMMALAKTRPDLAVQLRAPLMTHTAFAELLIEVYGRINRRTDHRLEGWGRLVVPAEDGTRMRRMSPWEVWSRGRAELTRIPESSAAMLMWKEALATERRVSRRMIEVWQKELGPDPVRYDALRLRDGEVYATLINPFSPRTLWVFDAKGAFVAALPAIERADRADRESMQRAFGRAAHAERVLMDELAPVAAEITRQRTEDARHNAAILAAAGLAGPAGAGRRLAARAAAAGQAMEAEQISREQTARIEPDETLDVRVQAPMPAEEPAVDLVDARD